MATNLNTNNDATYPDTNTDGTTNAARKQHQADHDALAGYTNSHDTATDPHGDRQRANHTGTQLAATISDFASAVKAVPGFGAGGSPTTDNFQVLLPGTASSVGVPAGATGIITHVATNAVKLYALVLAAPVGSAETWVLRRVSDKATVGTLSIPTTATAGAVLAVSISPVIMAADSAWEWTCSVVGSTSPARVQTIGFATDSLASSAVAPSAVVTSDAIADVFGASLVALWDADTLALTDGAAVAAWTDKKSSLVASQATTSKQPVFHTNVVNGHGAVQFAGSAFQYLEGVFANLLTGTNMTIFIVAKFGGWNTLVTGIPSDGSGGASWHNPNGFSIGTQGSVNLNASMGDSSGTQLAATTVDYPDTSLFHTIIVNRSATGIQAWTDGVSGGALTGTMAALNVGRMIFGIEPDYSSHATVGFIAEIGVANVTSSSAQRTSLTAAIHNKYGI